MLRQALFDQLYSRFANHQGFFRGGWGRQDVLENIVNLGSSRLNQKLANRKLRAIDIEWQPEKTTKGIVFQEGMFESPFEYRWQQKNQNHKDQLPQEIRKAYVQLVKPGQSGLNTPLVLQFAATGDEGFDMRRRLIAIPLAKRGIASLILENPFYGRRKPDGQNGTLLNKVTDFLQMSRAVQDEGIALINYLQARGHCRLGVTGISMGAYMAMSVAAQLKTGLAVAACLPTHAASAPYTKGVLRHGSDWQALAQELPDQTEPLGYMTDLFELVTICTMPVPPAVHAAILIGAKRDAYIPLSSTVRTHRHWQGSELRWLNTGHIGAILFHRRSFIKAVEDSFARLGETAP